MHIPVTNERFSNLNTITISTMATTATIPNMAANPAAIEATDLELTKVGGKECVEA